MAVNKHQQSENLGVAARIVAALRSRECWPNPPAGFESRCLERLKIAQLQNSNVARGWKVAASIVVVVALSGFAAWITSVAIIGTSDAPQMVEECVVVDAETEAISKEEKEVIIVRKTAGIIGAALTTLAVGATEVESEPTFVFLRPETSSFWHTATNNVMTVPVDYPTGATSANLTISGVAYNKTYSGVPKGAFTFELPPADSAETENVYDIALAFNDEDQTIRRAKLGLIQGISPDAEGVTRCLAPANGSLWQKARSRAVIPIPYGTTSFIVNGEEKVSELDGAQGWYALKINSGTANSLSLTANAVNYTASLIGAGGLIIIFK